MGGKKEGQTPPKRLKKSHGIHFTVVVCENTVAYQIGSQSWNVPSFPKYSGRRSVLSEVEKYLSYINYL